MVMHESLIKRYHTKGWCRYHQ